jgi:ATP-dependent DNA ligase I
MDSFASVCDAIAATTKKKQKITLVGDYLRSLLVPGAQIAATFLTGHPFPNRDERVLALGGSAITKVLSKTAGKSDDSFGDLYRQHGDLGAMAERLLSQTAKPSSLSLQQVMAAFEEIASLRMPAQKSAVLQKIIERASPRAAKYIIKVITGDLRIGLKESQVEEGIAFAFDRALADVRRANMLTGDIAETLKLASENRLAAASMRIFRPLGFMLATPIETPEVLFGDGETREFVVEEKYDGIRAQIHKSGTRVTMFSRTLDQIHEFPELATPIAALPGEFILDGEILGWQGDRPLPFTDLQKRLGRKVVQMNLWDGHFVPVRFIAFDLLYRDGQLLLETPLAERRKILHDLFGAPHPGAVQLAPVRRCNSSVEIETVFRDSLQAGHEGIVAKDPQSPYLAGRRGGYWFKLKEPFATLDVVVTAVEYGHGKRHGVLSDYTFAVRDGDRLLNIGKAYSGLTDTEIATNMKHFLQNVVEDQGYRLIVHPKLVIEVAFNNIQISDRHESGYALRFPRIIRMRPDKPVSEIDTLECAAELWASQNAIGKT